MESSCAWQGKKGKDEKTKIIDDLIKDSKIDIRNMRKILLLGTGDAGKSTFVRQLKIRYQLLSPEERDNYTKIIRDNTLQGIRALIVACGTYNIPIAENFSGEIDLVSDPGVTELNKEVARVIKSLWKSCESLQICFENHEHEILIPSGKNAPYFFQNATRFMEDGFIPEKDDIIRCRMVTTGFSEIIIQGKKHKKGKTIHKLVDVGGQRSERRKWIHYFEDSDAVIYLTAVNEFNMTLEEDGKSNRLKESLTLFEKVSGGKWLSNIPWIVFLNKTDLFEEKIKKFPLINFFRDYSTFVNDKNNIATTDLDMGLSFFEQLFLDHYRGNKQLFIYRTNALDTDNCVRVWKCIKKSNLLNHLNRFGLDDGIQSPRKNTVSVLPNIEEPPQSPRKTLSVLPNIEGPPQSPRKNTQSSDLPPQSPRTDLPQSPRKNTQSSDLPPQSPRTDLPPQSPRTDLPPQSPKKNTSSSPPNKEIENFPLASPKKRNLSVPPNREIENLPLASPKKRNLSVPPPNLENKN